MRPCAAILFFAAWPCFIHAQNTRSRENSPDFANGINENLIIRLVPCVKNLGLSKCVGAYGAWRAEKSLSGDGQIAPFVSERFPWQRYSNLSDDELYTKLCDGAERLLQRRPLKLPWNEDYSLQFGVTANGSLSLDILKSGVTSGRSRMKKFEKYFYELVPFILLPGLLISAILPFFLPSLKMMIVAAGMLNSMALTGAVFTLFRNNAFNDKYKNKVIYINSGYYNDKFTDPLAESPSEIIAEEDFDKYSSKFPDKYVTIDDSAVKDFQIGGNEPLQTDFSLNSDWFKQIAGKDDLKTFQNNFVANDWRKSYGVGENTERFGRNA